MSTSHLKKTKVDIDYRYEMFRRITQVLKREHVSLLTSLTIEGKLD